MNVLLVVPKRPAKNILPQEDIGVAYIAAAVKKAGHTVEVLDCHLLDYDVKEFVSRFRKGKYDLAAFKSLTIDYPMVVRYCDAIKKESPSTTTLIGGPQPSALPNYIMDNARSLDYGIKGEGEEGMTTLLGLMEEHGNNIPASKLNNAPGLIHRIHGEVRTAVNQPSFLADLDKLDFPDWSVFDIAKYPPTPGLGKSFPIVTTRGCPSLCTFCCNNMIFGRKVRFRTVGNVLEEVGCLVGRYGARHINILDNNFASKFEFVADFCDTKIKKYPHLSFDISQGMRIESINVDLVKMLDKAKCRLVGVGIESGDQEVLKRVNKGIDLGMIKEKLKILKSNSGIRVIGFFILGFPFETKKQIRRTIEYAMSLPIDFAAFTLFTPFPGTELFDELVKAGTLAVSRIDWSQMQLDRRNFKHNLITDKELKSLQKEAYFRFYMRYPHIVRIAEDILTKGNLGSYLKRLTSIMQQ